MLGIVAEFDHVQMVVRGQHEVALGSASHAPICWIAITATDSPLCRLSLQVAAYSTALLVTSPRRKHMDRL